MISLFHSPSYTRTKLGIRLGSNNCSNACCAEILRVTRWLPGEIFSERLSPTATLKNASEDLMTPLSKSISAIADPEAPLGMSITTSAAPEIEVLSGKSGAAAGPERWKRINANIRNIASTPAPIFALICVSQFQERNPK